MSEANLEEEAKKFLNLRKKEAEPEELRKELIAILERFISELKKKGCNGPSFTFSTLFLGDLCKT